MEPRPNFAFFENTLPRELWNKDGTKLEQSWEKVAIWRRRAGAFAAPVAASPHLGPKLLWSLATLFQRREICFIFVPKRLQQRAAASRMVDSR